jgi:hypothetical protein
VPFCPWSGEEDCLYLASEALRLLTHNPRFIASMFVKDVAGVPIMLTALAMGHSGTTRVITAGKKKWRPGFAKSIGCMLSNRDMVCTSKEPEAMARCGQPLESGVHRWHMLQDPKAAAGSEGSCFGVCTAKATASHTTGEWFLMKDNGQLYHAGSYYTNTYQQVGPGDVLTVILDFDKDNLSFELNGTVVGNLPSIRGRGPLFGAFCASAKGRGVTLLKPEEAVRLVAAKGKTLTLPGSKPEGASTGGGDSFERSLVAALKHIAASSQFCRTLVEPVMLLQVGVDGEAGPRGKASEGAAGTGPTPGTASGTSGTSGTPGGGGDGEGPESTTAVHLLVDMLQDPEPVVIQALKTLRLLADTQQFHRTIIAVSLDSLGGVVTGKSTPAALLCIFGVLMKLVRDPRNLRLRMDEDRLAVLTQCVEDEEVDCRVRHAALRLLGASSSGSLSTGPRRTR